MNTTKIAISRVTNNSPNTSTSAFNNAFRLHEAKDWGLSRHQLDQAVRCCLERLARGIYIVVKQCAKHRDFARFIDDERLLEMCGQAIADPKARGLQARVATSKHIALATLSPVVSDSDVLSRETASLIHGIPLLSMPPLMLRSHHPFISNKGSQLTRSKVRVDDEQIVTWNLKHVTSVARTAVDTAFYSSLEQGVVAVDYVLFCRMRELAGAQNPFLSDAPSREALLVQAQSELHTVVESNSALARSRRVKQALKLANGQSESPAESLARLCLLLLGITDIEQQVNLRDPDSGYTYRVDFLIRTLKLIIEIDGLIKYVELSQGGYSSGASTLAEEKKRQYRLERMGYRVVRVMWRDLMEPRRFAQVLRNAGIPV